MKVSPNFDLREFVPKDIWHIYQDRSLWFVDIRVIEGAEWLRNYFGKPITINNWHTGGPFQMRGFRPPATTTGGRLSQHKFGRAIDFNVEGLSSNEVFRRLKQDWLKVSTYTDWTTMEDPSIADTWTHIDLRQTRSNTLLIVKP